jgi:para-nitrobenzyl esterase
MPIHRFNPAEFGEDELKKFRANRRQQFRQGLFTMLALFMFCCLQAHAGDVLPMTSGLLVQTQSGPVRGEYSRDTSTRRWLGIPFAEPPVGERRWQAPVPHAPWTKELQAIAYGSACPQMGWYYGPPSPGKSWGVSNVETFGKLVGNEDCLKLNIWRPNSNETGLPVVVFVHGGANVVGHSSDPIYDGARLATRTHAVVVTINYRLGIFGWFFHPALAGDDPLTNSGNFGTLDIIQALKFVRDNAGAFGGDAKNVTLMGQSAGALNTYSLMGSPLATGLFHKAIVLSGLIPAGTDKQRGADYSKRFAAQLIVDDGLAPTRDDANKYAEDKGAPWLRSYLKAKSPEQLINTLNKNSDLWRSPNIFRDGAVLSANLPAAIEQNRFHAVPTIVGMTHDESKLLFELGVKASGSQLFTMMLNSDPDAGKEPGLEDLVSAYLLPSLSSVPYNALHWMFTKYLERRVSQSYNLLAKHNPKVFIYRFDWNQSPEPWRTLFSACHGSDLPFIFGNFSGNFFSAQYSKENQPGREALSAVMMNYIGAFIRSGDPNYAGQQQAWHPWTPDGDHQEKLIFSASTKNVELSTN